MKLNYQQLNALPNQTKIQYLLGEKILILPWKQQNAVCQSKSQPEGKPAEQHVKLC